MHRVVRGALPPLYGPVRYLPRALGALNTCRRARSAGDVAQDEVADHPPVRHAPVGIEQISLEERPERVAVGDPEDAVRADDHVDVQRVDIAPKVPAVTASSQDALDQL